LESEIRISERHNNGPMAFQRWRFGTPYSRRSLALFGWVLTFCFHAFSVHASSLVEIIDQTQPKIVKIYGAGGFHDMESYQSGILISPDGHILTAFSYVLDTDTITTVLSDGRHFEAKLLGADPRLDAAVLKIDATGLPCFDLAKAPKAEAGTRILAFSNLFGVAMGNEPVSVQKGTIAVVTRLDARRGAFETPYRGPVFVVDVTTNNPGAAGGALVNREGELLGMLGKELRNAQNNTWLNYAVPIAEIRPSVEEIRAGRFVARREKESDKKPAHSLDLASLGIRLIPDVLERTPPYIDFVMLGSPAERAGIRPDDLILLLGDRLVQSCKILASDLEYVDYEDTIKLTVQRGQDLIEVSLRSSAALNSPKKGQP